MGKTAGPVPPLREPRDQTQGRDWERPERSHRIAQTAAEVLLQILQQQFQPRPQDGPSAREVRRRCRPRGGPPLHPEPRVVSSAGGDVRASLRTVGGARHAQQLGRRTRRYGKDPARGLGRTSAAVGRVPRHRRQGDLRQRQQALPSHRRRPSHPGPRARARAGGRDRRGLGAPRDRGPSRRRISALRRHLRLRPRLRTSSS